MGCPSQAIIGDNLVFSVCTHAADTGILTDADDAPAYRIYEDETGTPILTGSMAKLDDDNTTGFYTETIACTAANGFEDGKTYTIYITAAVGGDTGGISYGFKAVFNYLRRTYYLTNNKMKVNDASGAATLRNVGDSADLATGSVTDDATTTIRAEWSWS